MLFSEEYKKRAVELSQQYTAQEVSTHLSQEFPDKPPPDERTIRRWRKVYSNGLIQLIDSKRKEEHFDHLVGIVNLLLDNEVSKVFGNPSSSDEPEADDYTIISEETDFKKIPHGYLVERIENNIDYVCKTFSVFDFWECLFPHLMAETKYNDFNQFYENHTIEFIDTLRILVRRKTFKGTCPVCEE